MIDGRPATISFHLELEIVNVDSRNDRGSFPSIPDQFPNRRKHRFRPRRVVKDDSILPAAPCRESARKGSPFAADGRRKGILSRVYSRGVRVQRRGRFINSREELYKDCTGRLNSTRCRLLLAPAQRAPPGSFNGRLVNGKLMSARVLTTRPVLLPLIAFSSFPRCFCSSFYFVSPPQRCLHPCYQTSLSLLYLPLFVPRGIFSVDIRSLISRTVTESLPGKNLLLN